MTEIATNKLRPYSLEPWPSKQVYNGLDCCVTSEVFEAVQPYRTPESDLLYNFERAMQAPALEMMLRGIRVDRYHQLQGLRDLRKKRDKVIEILKEFAFAVWDRPLNPNSPKQMKAFLYGAMRLPEQYSYKKGQRKVATDREALEKLEVYFHAGPIIRCILKIRDLSKQINVLETEVDEEPNGTYRMRTSYNVAGTETSRWSSSSNVFGGGTNLQNITEELRRMFIADEGKKLAYIDLEQAESRAVGWICWILFGAHAYLDACESDDLHTYVAKMVWRNLAWTGDPKKDKEVAEQIFYRIYSYRDMSKRGGHGTNYYGKPFSLARILKVKQDLIEDFQAHYFNAFPEIPDYHKWVAREIQLRSYVPTPLGTGRHFFGRPGDDATLREAIAYVPQHMVGVLLNLALWRIWYYKGHDVQVIGQLHDAVLVQYDEEQEDELIPQLVGLMASPLEHNGRTMVIPSEAKVGWNWQDPTKIKAFKEDPYGNNPDGLKKYTGHDERQRTESPKTTGLDRLIC